MKLKTLAIVAALGMASLSAQAELVRNGTFTMDGYNEEFNILEDTSNSRYYLDVNDFIKYDRTEITGVANSLLAEGWQWADISIAAELGTTVAMQFFGATETSKPATFGDPLQQTVTWYTGAPQISLDSFFDVSENQYGQVKAGYRFITPEGDNAYLRFFNSSRSSQTYLQSKYSPGLSASNGGFKSDGTGYDGLLMYKNAGVSSDTSSDIASDVNTPVLFGSSLLALGLMSMRRKLAK